MLAIQRCAAEYRSRYNGENPQEFMQFVDGAKRPVRWYAPEEWEWVDAILQTLVAQQGV